jgi:hypothetical protein
MMMMHQQQQQQQQRAILRSINHHHQPVGAIAAITTKHCNCRKTACLQKYCDCYAANLSICGDGKIIFSITLACSYSTRIV